MRARPPLPAGVKDPDTVLRDEVTTALLRIRRYLPPDQKARLMPRSEARPGRGG